MARETDWGQSIKEVQQMYNIKVIPGVCYIAIKGTHGWLVTVFFFT